MRMEWAADRARQVDALLARQPVLTRSVLAVLSGLLLFGSFPPRPWWFLAPIGFALLSLAVRGAGRLRAGFGYGFLGGLGFFLPLLPWVGIYVGPLPWVALATVCALYVGLFGVLARLLTKLPGWPVWVALAWTTTEWMRSSFPFGGFPWGRLAFGQADGWFLSLASVGGAPLVSFAVALTGTALAALLVRIWHGAARSGRDSADRVSVPDDAVRAPHDRGEVGSAGAHRPPLRARLALLATAATVAAVPLSGLLLSSTLPGPNDGYRTVTVAAIQGSVPRLGLDFNAQRRAVLDNHVRRTLELADAVSRGDAKQPDVVIWPENSSDIDPFRNPDAAALITEASEQIGAPILVGAVLVNSDQTTTNSVIVWDGAAGPGERHDKKIIQPFGEYLPMRSFFRLFSEYADRAGHFVPGDGDGAVRVPGDDGAGSDIEIGVATCYEVAFDRAFRDSMAAGAQLLAVPTNNATFGDSEMTYQQLAMSRIRAVEHGRALVVAATSGVSAIITADGQVAQQTPLFVPAALVADLPLRSDSTLATRIGAALEVSMVVATAALVAVSAIRWRRVRQLPSVNDVPVSR